MQGRGQRKRVPSTKYAGSDWDTEWAVQAATELHGQGSSAEAGEDEEQPKTKKVKRAPSTAAADRAQRQPAPRVSPKQRRQQQLIAALAERGLQLRSDSRLCDEYIKTGRVLGRSSRDATTKEQQLQFVVNIMDEMRFYHAHTFYRGYREKVIRSELRYRGRFDTDEVSEMAQGSALEEWASRFTSLAEAAARPELPRSLVDEVLRLSWPIHTQDSETSESDWEPSSSPERSFWGSRFWYDRF